jgi:predicted Zn-dependent protease
MFMRKQAAIVFTTATLLLAAMCAAQVAGNRGTGSVSGRVVTLDGHPAENARVELRDNLTGISLQSAYTNPAGQFEISNVSAGSYVVVATSGLDEARESVQITRMGAHSEVILRLPRSAGNSAGDASTVSVQQMKVPGKAHSAFKRAQEALAKAHLDVAWKEVGKALSLYPMYAEALVLRGVLKLDQNDVAGARADMEEAVKDDPGYAMGYIALGATYNAQAQYDDALRTLDRGVALSPTSWQAYFEMGKAYLAKGNYQAGLRQLDKAQQFAPDTYAPVHLLKAHALLGLKAYNEAIAELEAYLTRNPKGQDSDQARETLQQVRAFIEQNRNQQ